MTEHEIQRAIVAELRRRGIPHFAIPNGALRNPVTAVRLRAEGVSAGVPDMFLPVQKLFLETKTAIGRQSPEQKRWETTLVAAGYKYAVVRSVEDAVHALETKG